MNEVNASTTELPFYDQVIEGDCVEVLKSFPEETFDMVFADPPYNLQLQQELWRPNLTRVDGVDDDWDHFGSFAEYDQFTHEWLQACRRVLKRNGTLWVIGSYHNIFRVGTILQDMGFWTLNDIIWIKTNPMPNFRGVRFTNAHETLIWAQKEHGVPYTFNHHAMKSLNDELQMRSDWLFPICSGKERLRENGQKVHPTQKPESLLYRIISASSNPGDLILDPFFGTGTTGAVAKRLHRHWVGIERNTRYVEAARQRIDKQYQTEFDPPLFVSSSPRREPRVSFGSLLENGLIEIGQKLFFGPHPEICASVQADGNLDYLGTRGSIHKIAQMISKGPSNGWEAWYFLEPETQTYRVINELRQQFRDSESQSKQ